MTDATKEPSLKAVMARLDEICADTQAVIKRIDRIGAIAEVALHRVADLHRVPPKPPRHDGVVVWSLRHPRKALVCALTWVGTKLRKTV
jgi:hypothetical protein